MIMVLPFLTLTLTIWLGLQGQRRACLSGWALSLIIFGLWCAYHMTDALPIGL